MQREADRINKVLIGALVIISASISFASFRHLDVASENQSVQGANTNVSPSYPGDRGDVSVVVENSGSGVFTVYLDLVEPINLAGTELYFTTSDDLQLFSIECSINFTCINAGFDDKEIVIRALRAPDLANTPLVDRVKVADILYQQGRSGSVTINSVGVKESIVLETGKSINLIRNEEKEFIVQ